MPPRSSIRSSGTARRSSPSRPATTPSGPISSAPAKWAGRTTVSSGSVASRSLQRVKQRPAPLDDVPAEVRPAHALDEDRVAREQVPAPDEIRAGSGRVPRRRHDADLARVTPALAAEPQLLAVGQRLDRVPQLEALARAHEVGHARSRRQRRPAAQVVGVDVRVEDPDDARPRAAAHEALVPRRRRGRDPPRSLPGPSGRRRTGTPCRAG